MVRLLLVVVSVGLVSAFPVLAQQMQSHVLSTPDALKWVEPPTFPGAQLVIFSLFAIAGWPQLYLLLWFAPWMTEWRVINRLRSIAEHGGMERSSDRRRTTHSSRSSPATSEWSGGSCAV